MGRLPNYFQRLRRMLVRRGRTREDAEDLIQQAFLELQEYREKGGHPTPDEVFAHD